MELDEVAAEQIAAELHEVRYELDRLVAARLQGQLGRASELRYGRLTEREELLLDRLYAPERLRSVLACD